MTALFDSLGPAWRPVIQLAAGYSAAAVITAAAISLRLPSDHVRWVFAGTAAPAIALALGVNARTSDRIKLAVTSAAVFITAITLVAVPTIGIHLSQSPADRLKAIADLDPIFVAAFIAGFTCIGLLVRLIIDGDEAFTRPWASVLGDARWMSMREAKSLFPPTGKVVVGEAYEPWKERRGSDDMVPSNPRTWGSGGRHQVLFYDFSWGSTHMLFFAGSGGFKTTSTVIPTARYYPGSMVILDPALEIGQQVAPLRKRLNGPSGQPRKVFTIDPLADAVQGCDVLELLRRHPRQELGLGAYVKMLLTEKPKAQSGSDAFFEGNNFGLMSGLLMYVLHGRVSDYEPKDTRRPTLRQLRTLTALPEKDLKTFIGTIYANEGVEDRPGFVRNEAARRFIRQTLAPFVSMAQESWTGIAAQINTDTKWLSVAALADAVCNPDFSLADLPKGDTDVFLQFDAEVLKNNVGVVRILLGSMFQAMQSQERVKGAESVLFCLDEVDALGYMSALEEARDRGRKFGISLMLLYQSVGQIEKHFGKEGAVAWFDSAAIVSYAVVTSPETADRISKQAGECTVEVEGTSERSNWWFGMWAKGAQSQSRMTYSTSLQKRPLILPHEVREMRRDEQIIFAAAKPALRCGRAIFFRRPEMMEGLGKSKLREGALPKPASPETSDTTADAALSAAFDRLAASSEVATTDDGAAPTGFEDQDFDTSAAPTTPTAQSSPNDATVTAAIAAAAELEHATAVERASADEAYLAGPPESATTEADPQSAIAVALLDTAEAMFVRRPLGRSRR
ncbi:MAG: type IV secretory system conjugative DNA transfer family protein [Hyphomicrobiaceae bacterium]